MRRCAALVVLVCWAPAFAAADAWDDRIEFVRGNVIFVLLHEFGHLTITDYEVPILGNSEDAADTLAAVALIRYDRQHLEQKYAYIRMLLQAAEANKLLWQRGVESENPVLYLTRHPLSVQRAARIACLVYGSDVDTFEQLPELVGLPGFRADWCEEEYADAERAYLWVRDRFVRETAGLRGAGTVSYGKAGDERQEGIRQNLIERRFLEFFVDYAGSTTLIEESIALRARSCGSPNAYWDPDTRELVLCYELVDVFLELAEDSSVRELERQLRGATGG